MERGAWYGSLMAKRTMATGCMVYVTALANFPTPTAILMKVSFDRTRNVAMEVMVSLSCPRHCVGHIFSFLILVLYETAYRDGRQYDGKFVDDECEDKRGVMTWKDGSRYVGSFVKGKRQGHGKLTFAKGFTYEGAFFGNKYEGIGSCRYEDGRVYSGEFKRGKAHGHGKLIDKNGIVLYEGRWAHDAPA